MARITRGALAVALALFAGLALLPSLGRSTEGAETWFAEAITQSDIGLQTSYLWSKGRKMRADTVVAGVPVITIVNGATYYAIDGRAMTGTAIERTPKALALDAKGGRPFLNDAERLLEMGAEKIASDRIGGRLCEAYRLTDADGKKTVWMTQDKLRLPVKIELFGRASGQTSTTLINWSRDFAAPDAFFEPDPRVTLERISYEEYLKRAREGAPSAVPVLYADLLYGH